MRQSNGEYFKDFKILTWLDLMNLAGMTQKPDGNKNMFL